MLCGTSMNCACGGTCEVYPKQPVPQRWFASQGASASLIVWWCSLTLSIRTALQLWRSQPFAANVGSDFFMVGVVIEVHAVGRTHQLYTSVLSFLLSVNLKTN